MSSTLTDEQRKQSKDDIVFENIISAQKKINLPPNPYDGPQPVAVWYLNEKVIWKAKLYI